jgi:hypothetical protein
MLPPAKSGGSLIPGEKVPAMSRLMPARPRPQGAGRGPSASVIEASPRRSQSKIGSEAHNHRLVIGASPAAAVQQSTLDRHPPDDSFGEGEVAATTVREKWLGPEDSPYFSAKVRAASSRLHPLDYI